MHQMPTRQERIQGGLLGLLVGDALGVPYEFEDVPSPEQIEFVPPAGHWHAQPGLPPGTWSDDGRRHCACSTPCWPAAASTRTTWRRGCCAATARATCGWARRPRLRHRGDHGAALRAYRDGRPALESGPSDEQSNGNGSLMRVLPLALWHHGSDAELAVDAQKQSRVTHGHLRAQVCCALYCLWARRTLEGLASAEDSWRAAVACLRELYAGEAEARRELEEEVRPNQPA
jgi:ADP-ribosylglycohydrolase